MWGNYIIDHYTDVPEDMRLEALQAAVMLLPDENRLVLQSLLLFLSDLAQHSSENQVNAVKLQAVYNIYRVNRCYRLFHIM